MTKILTELKGKYVSVKVRENGYYKYYNGTLLAFDSKFIYILDKVYGRIPIARADIGLIHEANPGSLDMKFKDFDRLADKKLGV